MELLLGKLLLNTNYRVHFPVLPQHLTQEEAHVIQRAKQGIVKYAVSGFALDLSVPIPCQLIHRVLCISILSCGFNGLHYRWWNSIPTSTASADQVHSFLSQMLLSVYWFVTYSFKDATFPSPAATVTEMVSIQISHHLGN